MCTQGHARKPAWLAVRLGGGCQERGWQADSLASAFTLKERERGMPEACNRQVHCLDWSLESLWQVERCRDGRKQPFPVGSNGRHLLERRWWPGRSGW